MAWITSGKPIDFVKDNNALRRGYEVLQELAIKVNEYKKQHGVKPNQIQITETQVKEFLMYVRFYHHDKVKDLPAGFPTAGERGVLYAGIELDIIKPKFKLLYGN